MTHLTLRQLRIFVAVVEADGTTAAGRRLALSQSATSAGLAGLERSLGTRLFERVGRRLVLNDAGRVLFNNAREVLESVARIESTFVEGAGSPAWRLRVAASTTIANYILPGVVARFYDAHAGSSIVVDVGNTRDVVAAIEAFDVDMGFIEGPCLLPSVVSIPWLTDEMVVVCSPRHALARAARGRAVPLKALAGARWLMREPGSGTREVVEQALSPHLPRLASQMQLGSAEAIKRAAAEGLGVACLSRHVVQDLLQQRRLVVLRTSLAPLTRTLFIVHHRDKAPTRGLRSFVDHCLASRPA